MQVHWEEIGEGEKPTSDMGLVLRFLFEKFAYLSKYAPNFNIVLPYDLKLINEVDLSVTERKGQNRTMTTLQTLDTKTWLCLVGLTNIQVVRMQCIDYPFRTSLVKGLIDTLRVEKATVLWLGIVPIIVGQYFFAVVLAHTSMIKYLLQRKAQRLREQDETFARSYFK